MTLHAPRLGRGVWTLGTAAAVALGVVGLVGTTRYPATGPGA